MVRKLRDIDRRYGVDATQQQLDDVAVAAEEGVLAVLKREVAEETEHLDELSKD